jgi:alkanesulfonate monooxygenase SsuD/methylene tetrahydromethanopterin reductase-like flavin-dependent oxidoreductase (luciferase family)
MRHGIVLFTCDRGITPAQAAKAAEERGFDAFYVPEHTHIPLRREAPHPRTGDGSLPDDRYLRVLDPWVALATAATVTSRIRLGTAVALPAESDPITLAKTIATLDHLSGGRVTVGAGFGWNTDELADHGVPGGGPKTFEWIARHADGWMTTPGEQDISGKAAALRQAWAAAGRPGAPDIRLLIAAKPSPGDLAAWSAASVTELIWGLPDAPAEAAEAYLGRLAGRLAI